MWSLSCWLPAGYAATRSATWPLPRPHQNQYPSFWYLHCSGSQRKNKEHRRQFSNLPRKLRSLNLIFFQTVTSSKTTILLPENRIRKVCALPQRTDGGSHIMCRWWDPCRSPDVPRSCSLSAADSGNDPRAQHARPLPYTMLLPTHNITLLGKMVISRNSLGSVLCSAAVCLGNMYFSANTHLLPSRNCLQMHWGKWGFLSKHHLTELHFVWKETDGICMAVGQARLPSLLFRLVSYLSCYKYTAAILCLEIKAGEIYFKTGKYINSILSYMLY